MLIPQSLLNTLTTPRLRMHYDLRDSEEDQSQRMQNATEPGTVMPVQKHTMYSILGGKPEDVFSMHMVTLSSPVAFYFDYQIHRATYLTALEHRCQTIEDARYSSQ